MDDHGVIGWIAEENGDPELTCDDFDFCDGCPQLNEAGYCKMAESHEAS